MTMKALIIAVAVCLSVNAFAQERRRRLATGRWLR